MVAKGEPAGRGEVEALLQQSVDACFYRKIRRKHGGRKWRENMTEERWRERLAGEKGGKQRRERLARENGGNGGGRDWRETKAGEIITITLNPN